MDGPFRNVDGVGLRSGCFSRAVMRGLLGHRVPGRAGFDGRARGRSHRCHVVVREADALSERDQGLGIGSVRRGVLPHRWVVERPSLGSLRD